MRNKNIFGFLATFLIFFIFLTGCGNDSDNATEDNETTETKTVTTLNGEVEIPTNPERIVDISGSSEALLVLGITPVASADGDAYNTESFPSYLEGQLDDATIVGYNMSDTMDIEAILAADPDLIIMSERQEKIYDQLAEIAPVVMIKNFDNDWRGRLTYIAELFDQEETAEQWLADYDSTATAIGEEIMAANGEDATYLAILTGGDSFFVFVDAGVGGILYDDLGLAKPENLTEQDGVSLPVVTIEGLSEIDADHIVVVATEEDKVNLENNSVWQSLSAVTEGNVTFFDSSPVFTQSYQIIGKSTLLETLREELTN